MAINLENLPTNYITRYSDILFAVAVVSIVVMMIIPLPTLLLDILLTLNISLALTVLLVSMYTYEPLDFSVFPSLLLVATLFRLALNVSTTRLILLHADAGRIIQSFGSFVVGGNFVVGFIVFLILVIIQFIVITRGAERVAEVAARFTLDAMPGKQMSIDADLNAGIIDENEAKEQREKIRRESDFYGAMDGASKFVKGDAIAGIVITLINIIGGLIIGVVQQQMTLPQALQTYTLLTVGDGLVTQIPALVISTATGVVVTRAASEMNLGQELTGQLISNPKVLFLVASLLFLFAIVPGLPSIPFILLSCLAAFFGYSLVQAGTEDEGKAEKQPETEEQSLAEETEDVYSLLKVDPFELVFGYNLIPLFDPEQGGDMPDRISTIRRQMALELGIVVPIMRIRDDMQLEPDTYVFKIYGSQVDTGQVRTDRFLAMDSGVAEKEIEGIETTEPAFGLPAIWITEDRREEAEMAGYTVVDPPSVIATHLTEIIKRRAHELLGRQEVQDLLDNIREDHPVLVDELVPDLLSLSEIHRILRNLLREKIPIRNLPVILESLADHASATKDLDLLTDYVRESLTRDITGRFAEEGTLYVVTLSPETEQLLADKLQQSEQGNYLVLSPEVTGRLVESIASEVQNFSRYTQEPVILTAPALRRHLHELVERNLPDVNVLSYNEVMRDVEVQSVGMVSLNDES